MIIGVLCSRIQLNSDLLQELKTKIIQNAIPPTYEQTLFIILILQQNSKNNFSFSNDFLVFSKWNNFIEIFSSFVNQNFDLRNFVSAYFELLSNHFHTGKKKMRKRKKKMIKKMKEKKKKKKQKKDQKEHKKELRKE